MPKDQKYIILSAPSGAGKTTIARHLLNAGLGLEFSVTACSRSRRIGETDGVDYYFLSAGEFKRRVKAGDFLEWEEVYPGSFYGTLKSEIERICDKGENIVFDVDVAGGYNIKKFYGSRALAVFVQPPSIAELEKRLISRSTDNTEVIKSRIAKAKHELTYSRYFDVVIINDKLEVALKETEDVVKAFLLH